MGSEGHPRCSAYAVQCIWSKQHEGLVYTSGDVLQNEENSRNTKTKTPCAVRESACTKDHLVLPWL